VRPQRRGGRLGAVAAAVVAASLVLAAPAAASGAGPPTSATLLDTAADLVGPVDEVSARAVRATHALTGETSPDRHGSGGAGLPLAAVAAGVLGWAAITAAVLLAGSRLRRSSRRSGADSGRRPLR